jgi:NADPH2:quinone reductase
MNAIEITSFGAPDVLRLVQRPDPRAGSGEVCIRVSASGVNRPDVLQRAGHYPAPAGASDIPGLEVAGTIVDGDEAAMRAGGFTLGDRVCALVAGGGYAELCVAPVAQCLPVPAGLSDVEAASLPETFFTVWSNVFDRGQLKPGQTLLVQGGTSGIGVAAIQLAKALGHAGAADTKVIATAGTDEKCQACRALGADHAINYKTQDFQAEVMRLTDGRGVDVVLDMVAGAYVAKEVQCLADDGRLVIIAVQGGVRSEVNAGLVLRKRLTITGSTLRARSVAFKGAIAKALQSHVWPMLSGGRVKAVVHRVFAAVDSTHATGSGASQAHALLESNQHVGKIVLTWGVA